MLLSALGAQSYSDGAKRCLLGVALLSQSIEVSVTDQLNPLLLDRLLNPRINQRAHFFLAFGQVWCQNATPESSRLLAKTDPHSPGQYRTNGTLQNSADFAKAFGCKAGQKMVSENACHVW